MATTPSATPPSTPTIHCPVNYNNLNDESWCDIQYKSGCSSTGSISHLHHTVNAEILEKLLQEAQREIMSPTHAKSYPAKNSDIILMPEPSLVSSQVESLSDSTHQLDTSTPMLVTFDSSVKSSSINVPTSPINKIDKDISKTFTLIRSPCLKCFSHKEQIERLLAKQQDTEIQLNSLRKEYEDKCLSKTPDFMSRSNTSSISSSSLNEDQHMKKSQSSATLVSMVNTNSNAPGLTDLSSFGYASGIYNYNSCNANLNAESADWMKYWQSRPQTQPPKEWNFVHPNSANSKLKSLQNIETPAATDNDESKGIIAKYMNADNISKILFTHMASFIVGATLMFIVLKRQLGLRSSIYMK